MAGTLPDADDVGVIVVSPGPGLDELFFSLNAHCVVSGGQTMNPSTGDLADAVQPCPVAGPSSCPTIATSSWPPPRPPSLAHGKDPRQVTVVASRTLPQGIAALIAFKLHAVDLAELNADMTEAMTAVHTGEVTQAVRDVEFDGLDVSVGDVIGLHDGALVVKGRQIDATALALLERMNVAESEFITIYYGGSTTAESAQILPRRSNNSIPTKT